MAVQAQDLHPPSGDALATDTPRQETSKCLNCASCVSQVSNELGAATLPYQISIKVAAACSVCMNAYIFGNTIARTGKFDDKRSYCWRLAFEYCHALY